MHNLPRVVDQPEEIEARALKPRGKAGGITNGLVLLIAATALLLHFLPGFQREIQSLAQHFPFSAGGSLAIMTPQVPTSLDSAVVEAEVMKVAGRIESLQGELRSLGRKAESDIARVSEAVESLAEPGKLPLIVARIVLRHASGSLERRDIHTLASLAGSRPALAEPVAQLKALALEDILTIGALRDMFREQKRAAEETARRARMQWWEVPVDYAGDSLSEMGISQPAAIDQDQNVVEKIARELDSGRLDRALLELQAASPEVQGELSVWASAAKLRLLLDNAVLLVIDGFLGQISPSNSDVSPG